MTLQQSLEREKNDLQRNILLLEESLKDAPAGRLRISHSNGCIQYYFRDVPSAHHAKSNSIRKADPQHNPAPETASTSTTETCSGYFYDNNETLAQSIAQRDYNQRLLKELKTRYKAVKGTLLAYSRTDPENVMQSFSPDRQKLITPHIASKEAYIKQWLSEEYSRKLFKENTVEIYTMNGERVRSKSEKIIADTLYKYKIPYRYEYPLELAGFGLVHPDFMVMNPTTRKEFFWEHLGMVDDENYARNALKKLEAYEKNDILVGQELILTAETKAMPLNIRILEKKIRRYLL